MRIVFLNPHLASKKADLLVFPLYEGLPSSPVRLGGDGNFRRLLVPDRIGAVVTHIGQGLEGGELSTCKKGY